MGAFVETYWLIALVEPTPVMEGLFIIAIIAIPCFIIYGICMGIAFIFKNLGTGISYLCGKFGKILGSFLDLLESIGNWFSELFSRKKKIRKGTYEYDPEIDITPRFPRNN
jgi:hypothetical protein